MQLIIESTERKFTGFFTVDEYRYKHSLYRGGTSPVISRELLCRGQQGAVLFLYDLKQSLFILIEQCRAATLADPDGQHWLIEPVAGHIDQGESAARACIREGYEEAGIHLTTDQLEFVCNYYPSPGGFGEILHLYAAEVNADDFGQYSGISEEVEDIKIVKIPFKQAYEDLCNKRFKVASTYIALQWFFLHKTQA